MGTAEFPPPYRAGVCIARTGKMLVGRRDLKALKVAARQKIGNAGHGIRSIDGRGPLLEHLNPVHGDGRHGIDINEAAPDQARRDIGLAAAVDQY